MDTELLGLYAILLALLAAAGMLGAASSCCVPLPAFLFDRMSHLSSFTLVAAYGVLNLAQNKGWVKKPRKSKPVVGECTWRPRLRSFLRYFVVSLLTYLLYCSGSIRRQVRVAQGHRCRQGPEEEGVSAFAGNRWDIFQWRPAVHGPYSPHSVDFVVRYPVLSVCGGNLFMLLSFL